MVSHKNFVTCNCNYVYIKYFNHHFKFCVSKSFYYSTDDALLRKAFTDILNCCDIHFTYILLKGFSSDRKILIWLLSLLFHLQNCILIF